MPATAADIPPELFARILARIGDRAHDDKRTLGACALTCAWWAQQCRPYIFARITLRSPDDLRVYQALNAATPSRFVPIKTLLEFLTVEQRMADRLWLHHCSPFVGPQVLMGAHFIGPVPLPVCQQAIQHPLYWSVPRMFPPTSRCWHHSRLDNVHFDCVDILHNTLSDLISSPEYLSIDLANITWDKEDFIPSPFAQPLLLPLEYTLNISAQKCTDKGALAWSPLNVQSRSSHAIRTGLSLVIGDVDARMMLKCSQALLGASSTPSVPPDHLSITVSCGSSALHRFKPYYAVNINMDKNGDGSFSGNACTAMFYSWAENWISNAEDAVIEQTHIHSVYIHLGAQHLVSPTANWDIVTSALISSPHLHRVIVQTECLDHIRQLRERHGDAFSGLQDVIEFVYGDGSDRHWDTRYRYVGYESFRDGIIGDKQARRKGGNWIDVQKRVKQSDYTFPEYEEETLANRTESGKKFSTNDMWITHLTTVLTLTGDG